MTKRMNYFKFFNSGDVSAAAASNANDKIVFGCADSARFFKNVN